MISSTKSVMSSVTYSTCNTSYSDLTYATWNTHGSTINEGEEDLEEEDKKVEVFYYSEDCCKVPKSVVRIVVEEGVTSIPDRAFDGRKSLEEISLPSTITSIGDRAFAFCQKLKEIAIPEGTTSLGDSSFSHCYSLENIFLPESLTCIDDYAFSYCHTLKEIKLPSKLKRIGDYAFYNLVSLESINIPLSILFINSENDNDSGGATCFKGCINLLFDEETYNRLPNTVKSTLEENQNNPWAVWQHDKLRERTRLCEFQPPEDSLNFKGVCQTGGWGPQYWSITMEQLKLLRKHPLYYRTDANGNYNFTMRDLVELEIISVTYRLGMGYALLLNQTEGPKHARTVVAHSWDEPIPEFVDAIEVSGIDGPYWICAFALYQNTNECDGPTIEDQLGPDLTHDPLSTVLRSGVDSMIVILTERCNIYKRLWCVYEMYIAQKMGVNVILCPYNGGREYDGRYLHRNLCIRMAGRRVDSSLARCGGHRGRRQSSSEDNGNSLSIIMNSDERRIRRYIRDKTMGRFAEVDKVLEIIRCQYFLKYNASRIEHCKTKSRVVLKSAIERVILHLPQEDRANLMDLDTFLYNELEFHGTENYKRICRKDRGEFPQHKIDHDYYIIGKRKVIQRKESRRHLLLWKKEIEEEEEEEEIIDIFEKWRKTLCKALEYQSFS